MRKIIFIIVFTSLQLNAQTTISIRLDSLNGEHAHVNSYWPTLNLTPDPDFAGITWTANGTQYVGRSLIKFNLNFIDSNVSVTNALLSLYGNPHPIHAPGHSGQNSCYLRKVINNWDQYLATWANQPSTVTANQVILPQSTSQTQDYPDINVTALVSDMINHPSSNYGFEIGLLTEQVYRSMDFASNHCPDSTKRPKLVITYIPVVGIHPISNELPKSFNLFQNYPNPFNPVTKIKFEIPSVGDGRDHSVQIKIYDILGKEISTLVNENLNPGTYEIGWDGSNDPSGVYFYKLVVGDNTNNGGIIYVNTKKLVLMK